MLGRILAGAGAGALALALAWLYGSARYDAGKLAERSAWQTTVAQKEAEIADLRVAAERRSTLAVTAFADRLEAMKPIIVRSTDTVTKYAQTADGAARCLSAERVSGIDADAAALGLHAAAAPGDGDDGVRPDADSPQP